MVQSAENRQRLDTYSSAAPKIDMLLIRQPMVLSANSIAPDIKTTLRGAERLSMKRRYERTHQKTSSM
jgi:hypothetical protein